MLKDTRLSGRERNGFAQVPDRDLTSPLPHPTPPHPCQVLRTLSPLSWAAGESHTQVRLPDTWLGCVLKPGPLRQRELKGARCPRVGGSGVRNPPTPTLTHCLSLVFSCRAGQLSPRLPLPDRVRIIWHPAPRAVAESAGNLGFGGYPTPRRFSGAAKGSQLHSGKDRKGARNRSREAPE